MKDCALQVRIYRGHPEVRFTGHSDPGVQELIAGQVDSIVKEVVKQISPKAIVLTGSFGRGEGTILFNHDQLQVLSDYEVAVVTWKAWKRQRIIQLSDNLSKELDADVSLFWATPGRVKHNRIKNLSFGTAKPTRLMYDFKAGSVLLYGDLDLRQNQISPEEIPPWEGLRLIFNRLAEFLFQVDCARFRQWVSGYDLGQSLPIPKALLSAMNGLLVASGDYQSSLRERLKVFLNKKSFSINLDGLEEILKNAVDCRIHGVSWRGIPWELFRKFVLDSFNILVDNTFHIKCQNLEDFPESFHPDCKSQEVVVQYETGWLPFDPVRFENMIQRLKLRRAGLIRELPRFQRKDVLPSLVVQSLIPGMVLLTKEGSLGKVLDGFRESTLNADDILSSDIDDWDRWEALRYYLKPLWKTIC
jgi:hypothetical protein